MEPSRIPLADEFSSTYHPVQVEDAPDGELSNPMAYSHPVVPGEALDGQNVFVAASPAMRECQNQIRQIAAFDIPVLLLGESGTGKGMVAEMIHALSARAHRPFMKVNCAALPGELLESELFGHEAGAFTGAVRAKPGKFQACDRGTLLLDEVGELPVGLQAKLLQVLQDREFSRLGSNSTTRVDVRIIAATNRDVSAAIASGTFRGDLYYRLNAYTILLPPLRERREDIPELMVYFMSLWAQRFRRPQLPFSQAVLDTCLRYSWPGNIRELENFVRRYIILGDEVLALSQLGLAPSGIGNGPTATSSLRTNTAPPGDLKSQVRSLKRAAERDAIIHALGVTGGSRKEAARLLNISVRALQYKIRDFDVGRTDYRSSSLP